MCVWASSSFMPGTSSRMRSSQWRSPVSSTTADQPTAGKRRSGQTVLERALHARIEGVQAEEGERLGRAEAPAGQGVRPMVREEAVRHRVELVAGEVAEPCRALDQELLAERHVPHQGAHLAQLDLGAEL